jgi:transcriptional regulator with XRE-family HTH domain
MDTTGRRKKRLGWASKQEGSTPFGDRLKRERMRRNMTVLELADFAGLDYSTLCTIENRGVLPRIDTLAKVAVALDCTTDFLLGLEDGDGRPTRDGWCKAASLSGRRDPGEGGGGQAQHGRP